MGDENADAIPPGTQKVFDLIQEGHFVEAQDILLNAPDIPVNSVDKFGMSLLQQAAFKGSLDLCKLLIEQGANVNDTRHHQGYTALMFASLSGNPEVVRVLLDAGADPDTSNRIGRTAFDLATFTGQHGAVAILNNHLGPEIIAAYTKPQRGESEPRLSGQLAPPLQSLIQTSNVHPISIIWFLVDHPLMTVSAQSAKSILWVLDDIVERQMKQKETNEIMAFKVHIIHRSLKAIFKYMADSANKVSQKKEEGAQNIHRSLKAIFKYMADSANKASQKKEAGDGAQDTPDPTPDALLTTYAKYLLDKKDTPSSYPENLELFLRQMIKEFPYHQSVVMVQMVKTLAKTPVGHDPSAWQLIHQILLGTRVLSDARFCGACGASPAEKRCSACHTVQYCSARCQKLDWAAGHKGWCKKIGASKKKKDGGQGALAEKN